MSRKRPLGEQVVVIGGGSYGLGRAIAVAAARRGAKVVVGARTREALDGTLAEIEAAGGKGLAAETGDLVLLRTGWTSEHTEGPKPTDSPDNLFEPLPGDPGAHGRFDERSRSTTAWTLEAASHQGTGCWRNYGQARLKTGTVRRRNGTS